MEEKQFIAHLFRAMLKEHFDSKKIVGATRYDSHPQNHLTDFCGIYTKATSFSTGFAESIIDNGIRIPNSTLCTKRFSRLPPSATSTNPLDAHCDANTL